MTAICPGAGPSNVKAGYAPQILASADVLGRLAALWPSNWIARFATLLPGVTYDLSTMCLTDPPADPGFTVTDGLAMLNPYAINPLPFSDASLKLQQLIQRFAWYQFCECTGGGTPAAPAPPAAPAGLPDPAPSIPTLPAPACLTVNWPTDPFNANNSIRRYTGFNLWQGTPTTLRVTTTTSVNVATGPAFTDQIEFNDVHGALISATATWTLTNSQSKVQIFTIPANTYNIDCLIQANGTGGQSAHTTLFEVFCNGIQPGTPNAPCCPQDPLLNGQLEQILGMVTLLQRQLAPFAYVSSTAHAGLTGSGTLSIQGLLGCKVQTTTRPSSLREEG